MQRLIIFDMDGVIINSEPFHQKIEREMMADRGVVSDDEEFKQFIGMAGYDMWKILKDRYSLPESVDELRAEKRERLVEFLDTLNENMLVPGAVALIKSLHSAEVPLALASSSGKWYVERILSHFDLTEFFNTIVNGYDVTQSKPAPDIFLLVSERLVVKAEHCVVIEDSENGVKAARAAAMKVVGYQNSDSVLQDLSAADWVIDSFIDMDANKLKQLIGEY